jgi:hypothetical protein
LEAPPDSILCNNKELRGSWGETNEFKLCINSKGRGREKREGQQRYSPKDIEGIDIFPLSSPAGLKQPQSDFSPSILILLPLENSRRLGTFSKEKRPWRGEASTVVFLHFTLKIKNNCHRQESGLYVKSLDFVEKMYTDKTKAAFYATFKSLHLNFQKALYYHNLNYMA